MTWTHSVLNISRMMHVQRPVRVPLVLGIEFLKMHAGHKLLRWRESSSTHVLLWVLVRVHVMMLCLNVSLLLLLLLTWASIHHTGLLHLVGVSTSHLAIDVTVHDAVHRIPLSHGCIHGALRPSPIVQELAVRKGPEAGLGSVRRSTVHSHAIPVQASASRAVGHGHHQVFGHGFTTSNRC